MSVEMAYVFAVIAAALVLFVTDRVRVDVVALALPVVLLIPGIIDPGQAVSGFSNEATVIVAAMLILSLGLRKTGAVGLIGRWARRAPLGTPARRLFVVCMGVAILSAFLNNTTVVVVFIPVFMALAEDAGEPPSRYLMPLSFTAILGGTVTLVGTSTNIIVYGLARERGLDELTMFSIAPLGLIYLAVGTAYLFTVGRRLLPHREGPVDLSAKYEMRRFVTELRVPPDPDRPARSLGEAGWSERYGISVLGIRRGDRTTWAPGPRRRARPGDVLYVQGNADEILEAARREGLATPAQAHEDVELTGEDTRLVEVLVAPRSPLAGRTLREVRFRQRYDASVLAIQHQGRTLRERLADLRLEPGDILLVHGASVDLDTLPEEPGIVPLGEVEMPAPRPRALLAFGILLGVVAAVGTGLLSLLPAAMVGVVAMLATRCVRIEEVYAELDWMIVFLLAGVIPLGIAMEETGAAGWLAARAAGLLGPLGVVPTVAGFYLLTVVLTGILSNAATVVVLVPIALGTATELGMNPYALLVAVMFAASCDFVTPIGYQTNTLIYGPGGYRFADYGRVGGPLSLVLVLTASFLIPLFWPS